MAVSCTPADLAEAAKCFTCLSPAQREIIKTYLLAVIAGGSTDPATLLEAAKCFACLDPNQRKLINTYLLCQAANGGGPVVECGGMIWEPNETNVDNLEWYGSWTFGEPTTVSFPLLETAVDIYIETITDITSLSFPALTSVASDLDVLNLNITSVSFPVLETVGLTLTIDSNASLTSIDLSSLLAVNYLAIINASAITTISLPSLVTSATGLAIDGNTLLQNLSLPLFVPTNGTTLTLTSNALTAASVNHILARAIANPGYVSGSINTRFGTNSAPTGQGIVDKAALIARGVTVNTN